MAAGAAESGRPYTPKAGLLVTYGLARMAEVFNNLSDK